MRVLFIEPFYGGSHRLFADRVVSLSRHQVRLLTLPASFWKWRMRGGHLSLAGKIRALDGAFDLLLVSDMLSLAELRAAAPSLAAVPAVVYFHENQLNYPVPKGEAPDVHFGFTNLSTALSARALVFNSRFHRRQFLEGIDSFLSAMPDHRPRGLTEKLRPRSAVVYPGVDCRELDRLEPPAAVHEPLTILWNHRWEFDKRPEVFFGILRKLAAEGLSFRLHVLGENFQARPKAFIEAKETLGERIVSFGFLPGREEYIAALWDSDVVVSTSIQEFYGIAVMEAAYCRCRPLVPRRLVYPELYGEELLYGDDGQLEENLRRYIKDGVPADGWDHRLRASIAEGHDVHRSVGLLDDIIEDFTGT